MAVVARQASKQGLGQRVREEDGGATRLTQGSYGWSGGLEVARQRTVATGGGGRREPRVLAQWNRGGRGEGVGNESEGRLTGDDESRRRPAATEGGGVAAPAGQPAGIGGSAMVAAATRSSSRGGTVLVLSDASRRDFFSAGEAVPQAVG